MLNTAEPKLWVIFNLFVTFLLFLDLKIFHKADKETSIKEALIWSIIWFLLAIIFYFLLNSLFNHGKEKSLEFLIGYLIEKSLSLDNIFVFVMIFSYFKIPKDLQHMVLFWGIIGAIIFRIIFIYIGATLIQKFHWINYVFGAFLIYTGIKFIISHSSEKDYNNSKIVQIIKYFAPITDKIEGRKFFLRINNKLYITPLMVVIIIVAFTDLIFAIDSVPAIFSITNDPFIVYTANIFAIMGLRALFSVLDGIVKLFYYLSHCLSFLLIFIGSKMVISIYYKIPIYITLFIIIGSLIISIIASIIRNNKLKNINK